MTVEDERAGGGPRLVQLDIADEPDAWADAGFTVDGTDVQIGGVTLRLTGAGTGRGITGWTLAGATIDGDLLDGLRTRAGSEAGEPSGTAAHAGHPNGVIGLDHVVVLTPDLDRTVAAFEGAGMNLRRIREGPSGSGVEVRQAFFRLGPTIAEVVSGPAGAPAAEGPATFFGLAVDVDDLHQMATQLGDGLGPIKGAVQPGRRIATVRHKAFGMSVAIAAMDHRGDR